MSLDRKILERIEKEGLRIRSKWFFAMKDMIFGIGAISLIVLGSLSLALLFEIIKRQEGNLTWFSVPYAWAILLGVFLMAGYWLVIKIDSLYRIKFVPIVSMLFFLSLSFGYLTFASGKAEKIELELEKIPIYDVIMPISKEVLSDTVKKAESNKENTSVGNEDMKDGNDEKKSSEEDDESADFKENDEVDIPENESSVETREENEDDEIEESEKTSDINKDEDDSVKGEVRGVSKKVVKDEEEIEEEEADSEDETASLGEDSSEKSEIETTDAVDED